MHGNLCASCQRGGEEEEAKRFCLVCKEKLCDVCTKYHERNLITRDHKVLSFDKFKMSPIVTETGKSCYMHAEKILRYYCRDHHVPCCTACICTAHRKCDNIETVSETSERLRMTEYDKLSLAMEDLEKELTDIKQELEKNILNIEESSESYSANIEKLYTNILKRIQKVKSAYLNQLSEKTKACKKELQENAESIEDKIFYLKRCRRSMSDLSEETRDTQYVRKFQETSKKYAMLKDLYSKEKCRLRLVWLTSFPTEGCFESSDWLCDVYAITIKKYISEEELNVSGSESDISI